MTPSNDETWPPSPELLSAYFDGEFEGRDDLAPLRQRLEHWLADNPNACKELAEFRRLRHLWLRTSPPEPSADAWHKIEDRLQLSARRPTRFRSTRARRTTPRPLTSWKAAALFAGAAGFLLAHVLFTDLDRPRIPVRPFPVASEHEVVILHVEGRDVGTLVVGALPVSGPLELAGPGDITLTSVQPAFGDNMLPDVELAGPGPPIIWARAEGEED